MLVNPDKAFGPSIKSSKPRPERVFGASRACEIRKSFSRLLGLRFTLDNNILKAFRYGPNTSSAFKIGVTLVFSLVSFSTTFAKSKITKKLNTMTIEGRLVMRPMQTSLLLNPDSNSNHSLDLVLSKSLLKKIKPYRDINVAAQVLFNSPKPKIGRPVKLIAIKKVLSPLKSTKRYKVNKGGIITEVNY